MHHYVIFFAASLLTATAALAQSSSAPAGKPLDQEKPTQIYRRELGADQLVPADRSTMGSQSPTESLRQQYVYRGQGDIMGPDEKPLDINRVKVITPANYEALQPEAKAEIDADPYYVVTDKSRKEVMADFVRQYSRVVSNPSLAIPEQGVRVVNEAPAEAVPERMPTHAEKEAMKAAMRQQNAEPAKPGATDPD